MKSIYLIAIKAAIEAGCEILKVYESDDFQVEKKDDDSPLTIADKNAHLKIVEHLQETNITVLSEEGSEIPYAQRKDWELLWIVDPLDGTKEFVKRNGDFTVNIALIKDGKPLFGVIYVPVSKELFIGEVGVGAFKLNGVNEYNSQINLENSIKLPIANQNRPFTVMASRSHMSQETKEYIDKLKEEYPDLEFLSRGSSLKLCAVAEGVADVYPRFAPTMEWDTAAGQAIVEASGAKVTKVTGEPLNYNRENLLNPYFIVSR